jgi:hypothetical protein
MKERDMTADQFAGLVRAIVAALGGYLVAKGLVDAETVATLAGVAATAGAAIWSFLSKKKPEPQG